MKRRLNTELLRDWLYKNGSIAGENRIREVTHFSLSTLQKMKDGAYDHYPNYAARRALCDLLEVTEDQLFLEVANNESAS